MLLFRHPWCLSRDHDLTLSSGLTRHVNKESNRVGFAVFLPDACENGVRVLGGGRETDDNVGRFNPLKSPAQSRRMHITRDDLEIVCLVDSGDMVNR